MCGCETDCQPCAELMRMIELEEKQKNEVDRMTIVTRVYHQRMGKDTKGVDAAYAQVLTTKAQTFQFEMTVEGELVNLETGWIQNPLVIVIENVVGKEAKKVIPTKDQIIDEKKRVVEVYFGDSDQPALVIPPGMPQQFMPASKVRIRCKYKSADIIITALPR